MKRSSFIGFVVLEVSYWSAQAAFVGFISAYLIQNGMSSTVLSLMSAAYLLCAFAGSFLFGGLCDRYRTNRKVYIAGALGTAALMALIYAFADRQAAVVLLYPLLGLIGVPLGTNMDAWVLRACDNDLRIYGQIRATPSVMYAVVSAVFGMLIAAGGYGWMLWGGLGFMSAALAAAWLLPDAQAKESREKRKITAADLGALLADGTYRRLIILLFLIGCAVTPIRELKAIVVEHVGGDVAALGVYGFVSAGTQVPFILLAGQIVRIPRRTRFVLMTSLTALALALTLAARSMPLMLLGAFFYNAGYGVMLATMRETTEGCTPARLRNLGHNLSEATFTSFSGAVNLTYSGAIADRFGVPAMLAVSVATALAGLAIAAARPRGKGRA